MSDRSAPESGYDFGRKRQYRRDVWATFRSLCQNQTAKHHVLLMPSSEGDEIEVALRNGFRENRLHVVDKNPAIVALLKRRFPLINTYGVDLNRALERITKSTIRLRFANLDLCGPVGPAYEEMIRVAQAGTCFADMHGVACTYLRGRDGFWKANPEFGNKDVRRGWDDHRRSFLFDCLHGPDAGDNTMFHWIVYEERWGKYRSDAGTQTMAWSVFTRQRILPTPCKLARDLSFYWNWPERVSKEDRIRLSRELQHRVVRFN